MTNGPYIVDETCLVFAKNIEEENERLRAENEKLREALKPFADAVTDEYSWKYNINSADFRAAAAAIRESGG